MCEPRRRLDSDTQRHTKSAPERTDSSCSCEVAHDRCHAVHRSSRRDPPTSSSTITGWARRPASADSRSGVMKRRAHRPDAGRRVATGTSSHWNSRFGVLAEADSTAKRRTQRRPAARVVDSPGDRIGHCRLPGHRRTAVISNRVGQPAIHPSDSATRTAPSRVQPPPPPHVLRLRSARRSWPRASEGGGGRTHIGARTTCGRPTPLLSLGSRTCWLPPASCLLPDSTSQLRTTDRARKGGEQHTHTGAGDPRCDR